MPNVIVHAHNCACAICHSEGTGIWAEWHAAGQILAPTTDDQPSITDIPWRF
jgi:hypothetical protein